MAQRSAKVLRKNSCSFVINSFHHFHSYARPWLEGRAHVRMDLVICEFEFVRLEQPRQDNARLRLTERRADACPRSASERHVRKRRRLSPVGKSFRTEIFGILPDHGVAVREVNGIEHPLPGWDASLTELQLLCHAPVADVNGRIQAQAF